jgi:hypothetical protein
MKPGHARADSARVTDTQNVLPDEASRVVVSVMWQILSYRGREVAPVSAAT